MNTQSSIYHVLDLARWAPSGDNVQAWRFRILSDTSAHLILTDDDDSVFNIDKIGSFFSFGCLIETAYLAALSLGFDATFTEIEPNTPHTIKAIEITLTPPNLKTPQQDIYLAHHIKQRSVERSLYRKTNLRADDRAALTHVIPDSFDLHFMEKSAKRKLWSLFWINNKILMSWKKIFDNYSEKIIWNTPFPNKYMPAKSMGLDRFSRFMFRWALKDWSYFKIMQNYFGGGITGYVQLNIMPSISSAAHIMILAKTPPKTMDDYIAAGRSIQRFWLAATARSILHQPYFMPIAMSRHAKQGLPNDPKIEKWTIAQRRKLAGILGSDDKVDRLVWMGRIGYGKNNKSRSLRLPLDQLIIP